MAFRSKYGDYYVTIYGLRGDAGAYLSTEEATKDTTQTTAITTSVRVLFWSTSRTETSSKFSHEENIGLVFCGYDTLGAASEKRAVASRRIAYLKALGDQCQRFLELVNDLSGRITKKREALGLVEGHNLSFEKCKEICQSALVVQLVLMPYKCLRDYKAAVLRCDLKIEVCVLKYPNMETPDAENYRINYGEGL